MESQSKRKGFIGYLRLFSQRTSIRGIPKVENSKAASIKWFWTLFIITAHIIMIVLAILLIMRYFRYDKTIKTVHQKITINDFPEVTICSKRFFYLDTGDISPFSLMDNYSKEIYSRIRTSLDSQDFVSAYHLSKYQYTTPSFFQKYFSFLQQRLTNLSTNPNVLCNISPVDGSTNMITTDLCKIRPVFNPLYLNCLAFSIVENTTLPDVKMEIDLFYAEKPSELMIDMFKMDETVSDMVDDDGYQVTKVFINKVSDYPFDLEHEVPFDCQFFNHYIVEKSVEKSYFIDEYSSQCREEEYQSTSYGIHFNATKDVLCVLQTIQNAVLDKCNCFVDYFPRDELTSQITTPCNSNANLTDCYLDIFNSVRNISTIHCLPSCTKTQYSVVHVRKPYYTSNFSEGMDNLLSEMSGCDNNVDCSNVGNCILKKLFPNYNITCNENDLSHRKKRSISESNSDLSASSTIDEANNRGSASLLTESNAPKCTLVEMELEMKSKVKIQAESLIVEANTLLSQTGGMCAFITGLTFTFIAEVIETFIFWVMDLFQPKVEPQ